MTADEVLRICREEKVRFLRLQFTDILGRNKNVEIPETGFGKALEGRVLFDGSAILGFSRIEESDMLLAPDPRTFQVLPWEQTERGKVARLICDVQTPDGQPFEGCPRSCLRRVLDRAGLDHYSLNIGAEIEFFLFHGNPEGEPVPRTHDAGGYFDLTPIDRGETTRRDVVNVLEAVGFEVAAAHHEVAPGQHEIDIQPAPALTAADQIATFKWVVRKVAREHGLHATFMPKPIHGEAGSAMHLYQFLFQNGQNLFDDPTGEMGLSAVAHSFVAGQLEHARGFAAITNPLINSYKRLVPGFEAPTLVSWSEQNRSPMIRIPSLRGADTCCELRLPDPSCNPYLALAVMIQAGLSGIQRKQTPPPPVTKDVHRMSVRDRRRHRIERLPEDLAEALKFMERDGLVRDTLGPHMYKQFLLAKRQEWREYSQRVHGWELNQYLGPY